jgi:hypothetical protein
MILLLYIIITIIILNQVYTANAQQTKHHERAKETKRC